MIDTASESPGRAGPEKKKKKLLGGGRGGKKLGGGREGKKKKKRKGKKKERVPSRTAPAGSAPLPAPDAAVRGCCARVCACPRVCVCVCARASATRGPAQKPRKSRGARPCSRGPPAAPGSLCAGLCAGSELAAAFPKLLKGGFRRVLGALCLSSPRMLSPASPLFEL